MTPTCTANCIRCKHRFSWPGRLSDRPPCPNCGHRPPGAEQADRRIAQQYDARGTPQLFSTESSR